MTHNRSQSPPAPPTTGTGSRRHFPFIAFLLTLAGSAWAAPVLSLSLDADAAEPVRFAAEEIRREAVARGMGFLKAGEADAGDPLRISLGLDDSAVSQGYSIRVEGGDGERAIRVRGGDAAGVMYGGLAVAEAIRTGTLGSLADSDHKPHIARRGIKMNVPLDLRTPSYTDPSDAAQANIPEVWSMDFWRETFDDMARHRYNIISLWSLQYVQPVLYNRAGWVDLPKEIKNVGKDVRMAKDWKPGTLVGRKIKPAAR